MTTQTRVYFDSNIYSVIEATQTTADVRTALSTTHCQLLVSMTNVIEAWRIQSPVDRISRLRTIVGLGTRFVSPVSSYEQADEFLRAAREYRPGWVRTPPGNTGHIRELRRLYHGLWPRLRRNPGWMARDPAAFQSDIYSLVGRAKAADRLQQSILLRPGFLSGDPEQFWRSHAMQTWIEGLINKNPDCSDYRDWAEPYIRVSALSEESFLKFWMSDIKADAAPRTRLFHFVSYYKTKLNAGNL
jgi:hypothetical protein